MSGVKDRVALVTGAGSPEGIGFATARLLYSVGARVAITSTTDRINQRRDEIKGTSEDVFSQTADLTDSVAVNSLIEQIENVLGPIEIVINNAGMVQTGRDEPRTVVGDHDGPRGSHDDEGRDQGRRGGRRTVLRADGRGRAGPEGVHREERIQGDVVGRVR